VADPIALKIDPEVAVMPGTADAKRLLGIWFVRKSFYWIFFLGFTYGSVAALVRHETADVDVDWMSPNSVGESLLSPWAGLIFALILRFVVGWIALALTYPFAMAHDVDLEPRTNFGSGVGRFFDRLHIARAYRSLRWTHHVRQVALGRLGPSGPKVARLDPFLDLVNIASGVLSLPIITIAATITSTT
jgi:hypothetical protein